MTYADSYSPQLYHYLIAGFLQTKEASKRISVKEQPYFQISTELHYEISDCMKRVKDLSAISSGPLTDLQILMHKTAEDYLDEGKDILLPFVEVLYVSDRLQSMPVENARHILILVEKRLVELMTKEHILADLDAELGGQLDRYATLVLLLAVCSKLVKDGPNDGDSGYYAKSKLRELLDRKKRIQDSKLVAQVMMELGVLLCDSKKTMEGRFWLQTIEQDFASILTLDKSMRINEYLRQAVPDEQDDFEPPPQVVHQKNLRQRCS